MAERSPAEDPVVTLPRGTVVGLKYTVEMKIGQGGHGTVYLASDVNEGGRAVALKVLRSDRIDADRLAGFRSEYATLARLRHPHVETVFDFGKDEHGTYIAKEYLPGQDLIDATAAMTPEQCLRMAVQLFRALAFLHARSLIHNDVKPDNMIVVRDQAMDLGRRGVLIDFGIASVVTHQAARSRFVAGTLGYMAPERLQGAPADARTDIYAAGILLFRLLTREYPFDTRGTPNDVMAFHLTQAPPPLRSIKKEVPGSFQPLMDRLLAKDPRERFQTAKEVVAAIGGVLGIDAPIETEATQEGYIGSVGLVGRDTPLSTLTALAERCLDGNRKSWEPAFAVIEGAPGMGKSRLLAEVMVKARLAGGQVLTGIGRRHGGALGPLRTPLRHVMTEEESREAFRFLDESDRRGQLSRDAIITALGRLLLERGSGVVLAIDDLHRADEMTFEALLYVARRVRAMPSVRLFCLLATRPADPERNPKHAALLQTFAREGIAPILRIDALGPGETMQLVTQALGRMPDAAFARAPRSGRRRA
ncbi:MAG: serine/threonine-protein kinase [Acidobacteriota bacterium]